MRRRNLILGTAGHIDHGKTSLVHALTGVNTDRLEEEKRRGITIELGFTSFDPDPDWSFGIVDVPGHEGFVRTMLAGATGMDVVLLVVAADEGAMPQTREHLDIIRLLQVDQLVVALTKSDLVEDEWLELVVEDVKQLLADSPYADAPIVSTSVKSRAGLEELTAALLERGRLARDRTGEDTFRLPIDRAFTVDGTGTVVTGTLWSGRLRVGENVRVLPGAQEARVRALQVHGDEVDEAWAGQRTAVALTGPAVKKGLADRGAVLVADPAWKDSLMLTARLEMLESTAWIVEHGQRVRVHLGTAEVMARVAVLEEQPLMAGDQGFIQLRLESPLVARAGDRFVLRSYSPVATVGGGTILEPQPPKRKKLSKQDRVDLHGIEAGGLSAIEGVTSLATWRGVEEGNVAVLAGLEASQFVPTAAEVPTADVVWIKGAVFSRAVVREAEDIVLDRCRDYHVQHPLEPGVPLEVPRGGFRERSHADLPDGIIERLASMGAVLLSAGRLRLADFIVKFSPVQERLREKLRALYQEAGPQPPATDELPTSLGDPNDLRDVLAWMAAEGELVSLGGVFLMWSETLDEVEGKVLAELGGSQGLGPAAFKEIIPVSRKHLIPILAYFDDRGITKREGEGRSVRARS